MIKTILKMSVALGLLAYLISNGKLDFKIILRALENPKFYIAGFLLVLAQCTINAMRWKLILSTQTKEKIPTIFIILVTWVGMFFNTVLPGAVSGDLVKMMYLNKIDEHLTKTSMFLTVFMDRIYGLIGLILVTGIISISRYNYLIGINKEIKNIISLNLLLLLGIFAFIATLFVTHTLQKKIIDLLTSIPKIGAQIAHIFERFWAIGKDRKVFFKSIGISILGQLMGLSGFFIITKPIITGNITVQDIFTFVPIGMIITAIPLAPGGMGVGHVAFDKLFQFLQVNNGADLFNVFWVTMLTINLLGIFPYIGLGKSKKKNESLEKVDLA